MTPQLDAIGLVVDDMARSLSFYRHLGLDLPVEADDQPHVEAQLPGGLRLLWDTAETVRSFDPGWQPPASGHRMGLAFVCATPAEVDATYDRLVNLGYVGHKPPWDAVWGSATPWPKTPTATPSTCSARTPDHHRAMDNHVEPRVGARLTRKLAGRGSRVNGKRSRS